MIFDLYMNSDHLFTIRRYPKEGSYICEGVKWTESRTLADAATNATQALNDESMDRAINIMHTHFTHIIIT
jgi:hypothetical protein